MTADVNVTEKVAREADRRYPLPIDRDFPGRRKKIGDGTPEGIAQVAFMAGANFALSTLADPDVLAGIAGVLRGHVMEPCGEYRPGFRAEWWRCLTCGGVETERRPYRSEADRTGHQAAAVVEWLRGERA